MILTTTAVYNSLASDPVVPVDGETWYNSTDKRFRVFRNGTKVDVDAPIRIPAASLATVNGVEATKFLDQFPFNPSVYGTGRSFTLVVVLSVSDVARIGQVFLRNLTDIEFVTLSGTATTSSTAPAKLSLTLTVGAAAGNLKTTEKIYEVRITNDGTLASEQTFLGSAYIEVI